MRLTIHPGDLAGLDRLETDAVLVPLDGRVRSQPKGVAGLLDWRLSGRIARMLRAGIFEGRDGEVLLLSPLGRVKAKQIFLFGLGDGEGARSAMERMLAVARGAGAGDLALAPPADLELLEAWLKSPALEDGTATLAILDADGSIARARPDLSERDGKG